MATRKPIIFQPWKVQKILNWDFETQGDMQTRRLLRVQPLDVLPMKVPNKWVCLLEREPESHGAIFKCRYGIPGDQLWVREKWANTADNDIYKPSNLIPQGLWFFADGCKTTDAKGERGKWRPSIFMPKWASRIDLEITGVKCGRAAEISEADAIAEGVGSKAEFLQVFEKINGPGSIEKWVFAISYKAIRINQNARLPG